MRFKVEAHLASNITVVFDRLDVSGISRDRIRASVGQAALMDAGDLLVVMIPSGIVLQIAERRVIVVDQTQSPPGQTDIWSPTTTAVAAVVGSNVIAYGFNYDVRVVLEDIADVGAQLTRLFLPNAEVLRRSIDADSVTAIPRLVYYRGRIQYDLRLESTEGSKLVAHLNVHFADKPLPDPDPLKQSFLSEINEINRVLEAL